MSSPEALTNKQESPKSVNDVLKILLDHVDCNSCYGSVLTSIIEDNKDAIVALDKKRNAPFTIGKMIIEKACEKYGVEFKELSKDEIKRIELRDMLRQREKPGERENDHLPKFALTKANIGVFAMTHLGLAREEDNSPTFNVYHHAPSVPFTDRDNRFAGRFIEKTASKD